MQLYRTDPEAEHTQVKSLEILRRERDNQAAPIALKRLRDVALGEDDLFPAILQAVKVYAPRGDLRRASSGVRRL